MKTLWLALDRGAALIAIFTALVTAVIWILANTHLVGASHVKVDRTAAFIAVICLTIVGVGFVVGGLLMRHNNYTAFSKDRGRGGTVLLLTGSLILAIAVIGLFLF